MRKILKILPGLLSLLLCSYYGYGQLDMSRQSKDIEIPNTQTYDFIRYGNNVGASLYTGTVNLSIPFYTYKDRDFEIPISFDYASNGFKPNQRAGDVGLGWMLNVGGCITREVRGIPDEKGEFMICPPTSFGISINGFLYLYNNEVNQSDLIPDIFLNESNATIFYQTFQDKQYECEPDIFHFNFMGYSGDFHLWYNGEVKVYNTNFNANELQFSFSSNTDLSITIKTGNGFIYEFGNHDIFKEYTETENMNNPVNRKNCHTWKLYKITAPNGRTVIFNYDPIRLENKYINYIYNYNPTSIYAENIFCDLGICMNSSINETSVKQTKMFTYPLKKIAISDGIEIDFNYELTSGEKALYGYRPFRTLSEQTYKLNKITVIDTHKNDDSIIKECNISYKKPTITNTYNDKIDNVVYFLGSLDISGEGIYDFEYFDRTTKGFPVLGTFSVDHWGYYNGRSDDIITNFISYLNYNDSYNETMSTNSREHNYNFAKAGMLQRITYPAGGYSILEYEPHDYYYKMIRTSSSFYEPAIISGTGDKTSTGGMRIKKVTNYSHEQNISSAKEYIYEASNGKSSGILLNFPRYGIKYKTTGGEVKYYSLYDHFKYDGTHMEYSKVTEINSDGSKIEYHFTNAVNNYIDILDADEDYFSTLRYMMADYGKYTYVHFSVLVNRHLVINLLTPVISKQPFRGKLLSKNIISNTGNLLRTETNSYNYKTVHSYDVPLIVSEYYKYVTRRDLNTTLQSNTTTDYFGSNSMSNSVSYTYNSYGQVSTATTTDSKGNKIVTKHKYVTDIANPSGIHKAMLDNNVINNAIEDSVYMIKSGTAEKTLLEWRKYSYCQPNIAQQALICLQSVDEYDMQESAWVKASTYIYDKSGRVLEKTDRNGIQTAYVWGYSGLYLVAKIDNCSLSKVKSISGLGNIETASLPAGISEYESALRSIPGAQVTALEYYPFTGLKKMTDPGGKATLYEYNATGKLKSVADDANNLRNKYHYSPDDKN